MIHEKFWLTCLPQENPLAAELNSLWEIYNELDSHCMLWQQRNPYYCPPGCGACCTHFTPDVLPIEAIYLAAFLVSHGDTYQAQLDNLSSPSGCSFYNPDKAEHCTIYAARPLICRLFAYSALPGIKDEPVYNPCNHMQKKEISPVATGAATRPEPPVMTVFTHRVASIQPAYPDERLLLPEQLLPAIRKILFVQQLYRSESIQTQSEVDSHQREEGLEEI